MFTRLVKRLRAPITRVHKRPRPSGAQSLETKHPHSAVASTAKKPVRRPVTRELEAKRLEPQRAEAKLHRSALDASPSKAPASVKRPTRRATTPLA